MTLKLGKYNRVSKFYQDVSSYNPGLTLNYFTPRSNLITKLLFGKLYSVFFLFILLTSAVFVFKVG